MSNIVHLNEDILNKYFDSLAGTVMASSCTFLKQGNDIAQRGITIEHNGSMMLKSAKLKGTQWTCFDTGSSRK